MNILEKNYLGKDGHSINKLVSYIETANIILEILMFIVVTLGLYIIYKIDNIIVIIDVVRLSPVIISIGLIYLSNIEKYFYLSIVKTLYKINTVLTFRLLLIYKTTIITVVICLLISNIYNLIKGL